MLKYALPLVGHRKASNEAKRYTRRPLVVVYYSVDFSFDYRAGEGPQDLWGWGMGGTRSFRQDGVLREVWLYVHGSLRNPSLGPLHVGGSGVFFN